MSDQYACFLLWSTRLCMTVELFKATVPQGDEAMIDFPTAA